MHLFIPAKEKTDKNGTQQSFDQSVNVSLKALPIRGMYLYMCF